MNSDWLPIVEWLGLLDYPILHNSDLDRLANASYRERLSPPRTLLDGKEVLDPQTLGRYLFRIPAPNWISAPSEDRLEPEVREIDRTGT